MPPSPQSHKTTSACCLAMGHQHYIPSCLQMSHRFLTVPKIKWNRKVKECSEQGKKEDDPLSRPRQPTSTLFSLNTQKYVMLTHCSLPTSPSCSLQYSVVAEALGFKHLGVPLNHFLAKDDDLELLILSSLPPVCLT